MLYKIVWFITDMQVPLDLTNQSTIGISTQSTSFGSQRASNVSGLKGMHRESVELGQGRTAPSYGRFETYD